MRISLQIVSGILLMDTNGEILHVLSSPSADMQT